MKKLFFLLLISAALLAQKSNEVSAKIYGFVRFDAAFNSRLVDAARESYFVFHPYPEELIQNKEDKNEVPNFNFYSVLTRVGLKLNGPDVLGAKASATIETDFFGFNDQLMGLLRLRVATIDLNWDKTSLSFGQNWHPMFISLVPSVVSPNAGTPFQPFGRFPQVKLSYKLDDNFKFIGTLLSQRDFANVGLSNSPDNTQIRYSLIPNVTLQLEYLKDNNLIGAGVDFKSLIPQTVTSANYKTDKRLNCFSPWAYLKFDAQPLTIMAKGVYGQNLTNVMLIGGFGIKSIDPVTKEYEYTPLNTISGWIDLNYKIDNNLSTGIYVGYSKLLSSSDTLGSVYGRGINTSTKKAIDNLLRISPRLVYTENNIEIYAQLEMTSAAYGDYQTNHKFELKNLKTVTNYNLMLGAMYNF